MIRGHYYRQVSRTLLQLCFEDIYAGMLGVQDLTLHECSFISALVFWFDESYGLRIDNYARTGKFL